MFASVIVREYVPVFNPEIPPPLLPVFHVYTNGAVPPTRAVEAIEPFALPHVAFVVLSVNVGPDVFPMLKF